MIKGTEQNLLLSSAKFSREKSYWVNKLSGELVRTRLMSDFDRLKAINGEKVSITINFPKDITEKLFKLSKNSDLSLYIVLLTSLKSLLYKYTGVNDIIIGSPIYSQNQTEIPINNVLALRDDISYDVIFKDFLIKVRETVLKAYENQNYPLNKIIEYLNITLKDEVSSIKDQASSIFDIICLLKNIHDEDSIKDLNSDITVSFHKYDGELECTIIYNPTLFRKTTINQFGGHFLKLLSEILNDITVPISDIKLLSKDEEYQLLEEFNFTKTDYSGQKTICQRLEEQVKKNPENIAVVCGDKHLTYGELNEKANQLARALIKMGVHSEIVVAILTERSLEMIIAILAILKAGGAYLPIDTGHPMHRIKYILENSGAKVLLTQNKHYTEVTGFIDECVLLDDEATYQGDKSDLGIISNLQDLAYVIYTSGTTGKPKGVMVEHRNLIAYIHAFENQFFLTSEDRVLQQASYSFDAFVEELYPILLKGGRLVIPKKHEVQDINLLVKIINENNINLITCSPLLLNELNKYGALKSVHTFISGGDVLKNHYISNLLKHSKVYNTYGPTETTVCATYYQCMNADNSLIPIGKPISNYTAYILNDEKELLPIGVPGELYISGDGVVRGYLDMVELSAEKFVYNPFYNSAKTTAATEVMYKTGDLARWLSDGNIEFWGRIDQQVKIRGFRIELAEIEDQLMLHDLIEAAVVVDIGDDEKKYLCAYIVSKEKLAVSELKEYLSKELPYYMIPSYFVRIERIPYNTNGKLDRKSLPLPDASEDTGVEYIPPSSEIEKKLSDIWVNILEIAKVGIRDNFFQMGGHSLKATQLAAYIYKEFKVEIPLMDIFENPTIEQIAKIVSGKKEETYLPIGIQPEKEYYTLSSAQKRMYILQQLDPKSTAYNMPGIVEVKGALDYKRLENSFKELIQRHETLRTYFETMDEIIVQKVSSEVTFKINYKEVDSEEEVEVIKHFVESFDLSKAPLLRVELIKLGEDRHTLLFDMHHIISDGVSMNILVDEFIKLYKGEQLKALKVQYKDYVQWQNELLKSDKVREQEKYWLERFGDEIPVLNISSDFSRPTISSFEGDTSEFLLGKELTKKIRKIAEETNSTVYMVLLSAVNILLSKYSGQEDIVVGSPIAGRPHADLQSVMGMFVNMLAMRNFPTGNKTYKEFLFDVRENALKAYENQDYQFEELVERLNINRDISRNPVFDIVFDLQGQEKDIRIDDLDFKLVKQGSKVAKFDLIFTANELTEDMLITVDYPTKLFKQATVEGMLHNLKNILISVAENIQIQLYQIDILTEEEKHKLLYEFNDTYKEYPNKTIHQLFEEQVTKNPDKTAVVYENEKLTYRELNERANQLARLLREKGVEKDKAVGVMVDKSLEMIIGVLGILKAGGAYLPIDPDYPRERIEYMLEDSGANILLTQKQQESVCTFNIETIELENRLQYERNSSNLEVPVKVNDLAYIIYTSGTTGEPKGVMIEHKNVVRLVKAANYIKFDIEDRILQTGAFVFDASTFEIWGALLNGLQLYLVKKEVILDAVSLETEIRKNAITTLWLTSQLFNQMVDYNPKMFQTCKYLIVGGDVLSPKHINAVRLVSPNLKIINGYGPTENTTFSTCFEVFREFNERIPIGRPIGNSTVYILDSRNQLLPIGAIGELCVGGDGLSRGYLKKPELTADKFIENPFKRGEKIYKTGDMARWLPDGSIEFIGRLDQQVKINGFRIELGEIESQLLLFEGVKEAAVVAGEDSEGNKHLLAYITGYEKPVSELREAMLKKLPRYMVPAYFVQMESLPLTSGGKIDRKALPQPDTYSISTSGYTAPENKTQESLVQIWSELLNIDSGTIGIKDNFFELGGHSLKASSLIGRIQKTFNVKVPLKEIFQTPTIKSISKYILSAEKNVFSSIEIAEQNINLPKDCYMAASAQKRLYILNQYEEVGTSYNMSACIIIEGMLEREKVQKVFEKLIKRHEALRTSFEVIDEEIVQRIHQETDFSVGYIEGGADTLEKHMESFIKPFDLSNAPLIRTSLVRLLEDKHALMFDMHHIISDGTSINIIVKEFIQLYQEEKLPELRRQYKDYALWQEKVFAGEEMTKQAEYWKEKLSGELTVLNLLGDYPRPVVQSFEGETISFTIDMELTERIKEIAVKKGATEYMILLAAYNILLSKYSGQDDIIVGSPIAGRQHEDLHNIIGMFVNTLAIRNNPTGNKTVKEFLEEVKENCLKAYEHQDLPFEELVKLLDIKRDMSRNPLFDTMFAMQNMETTEIEINGLKFTPYEFDVRTSMFDITLTGVEKNNYISFTLEYSTRIFKRETMQRFADSFIKTLEEIVSDASITLEEVDVLPETEKKKLLIEFNNTEVEYPSHKSICQLFEEQAEKTPNNIAVVFKEQKLTYRELNQRANIVGRFLLNNGVAQDTVIGIIGERSIETVIGILGILKAGGAYLPVDPDYPEERISYFLNNTKASFLLTASSIMEACTDKVKTVSIKEILCSQSLDNDNLELEYNPQSLMYVLYTSGSTGTPKGAMIKNISFANLLNWFTEEYEIGENDRVLLISSVSFDLTQKNLYSTLTKGGILNLFSPGLYDYNEMLDLIKEDKITIINCTPSAFYPLLEFDKSQDFKRLESLRCVFLGGEPINVDKLKNWVKSANCNSKIVNTYGPTECTDIATAYTIDSSKIDDVVAVPIGKPIYNVKLYVVDNENKTVPIGVAGELCIGGAGLGRGYYNDASLTDLSFVENPFERKEKMYKTGDLVRWLSDGNIEFLGRIDQQVKINGFRIELGEVESCLLLYEGIKEAAAVAGKDSEGNKHLIAYIAGERKFEISELRAYLLEKLPRYMVPLYFVQMESLPLTPSGKIDRKAFPEPDANSIAARDYAPPENKTQEKLIQLWSELLNVSSEAIGIEDNFFELGGHSLRTASLIARLQRIFNVNVPLREVFKAPTIKSISQYIINAEKSIFSTIEKAEQNKNLPEGYYIASSAQKRLYILSQYEDVGLTYNMTVYITIEGMLETEKVKKAFGKLIERHEALRTSFEIIDGEIVQRIHKEVNFSLDYIENRENTVEEHMESFTKPFDLSKAPLIRTSLVRMLQDNHVLMFDMHHIISDGASINILIKEFIQLYQEEKLPELRLQYKDYAQWQESVFVADAMRKQAEYWKERLSGELPVLNQLGDYPRPAIQSFEGETISFIIDKELTGKIKELAVQKGATEYMILLAACNVLISKYSGQADIIMGSPIAGRQHEDLDNILGMFVNTLAIRNNPAGDKTLEEFLKEVKENCLKAYENQDLPFGELVKLLDIKRDMSRNPLFDTMFVMQNMETVEIDISGLKFILRSFENKISKFDLTIYAEEVNDGMLFKLEYCTALFKQQTVEQMGKHLISLIKYITGDLEILLNEIELFSEEEKQAMSSRLRHTGDSPNAIPVSGKKLTAKSYNEDDKDFKF